MPIGVDQGDIVEVIAQFRDSAGNITLPPPIAVFLNVSYIPAVGGSSTTQQLPMAQAGSSYTASWNSGLAHTGSQASLSFVAGSVTLAPPDPILLINLNT